MDPKLGIAVLTIGVLHSIVSINAITAYRRLSARDLRRRSVLHNQFLQILQAGRVGLDSTEGNRKGS